MVLSSPDMWFCVSCYSCANRCPRDIHITDVMASLRHLATKKGYTDDREAQFGKSFSETVQHHGRMFEPELMFRYYLRSMDIPGLLGMVPLGIKMLLRNKLPFLPERISDPEDLNEICKGDGAVVEVNPGPSGRWLPWLVGAFTMVLGAGASGVLWLTGENKRKEDA
jgi:Fe-S oxidoreductase